MSLVSGYNADSRTIQDGSPVAGKFSRLQLDRVILAGGSVLAAGLAKSGAIVGGVVNVYTEGVVEFLNWSKVIGTRYLTVGQAYRLSSQLGKLTTSGSGQLIGLAVSKTELSLQIGIESTGSTTTTPSNTSQFATLDGLSGEAANRLSADAYLQSQIDTKAGTGFTSASTAGDLVIGTLDSAGLSIGIPAYLTTAALSQDSSKYAGTTAGMTGGSLTVDTAGVAISLPAYLTTAALSQDSSKYAGTNGAMTGGSLTVNTSGISINLPSYLTTAQPVGDYAGTNTSVLTTAGTDLSLAVNTSGFTVAYPKWITTYAVGAGTGFTSATTAGTAVVGTLSTNGLSLGIPAYLTTTPAGAGITNIKVSAGSYSTNRSDITFNDSNGVSFGQDTDGVLTASVFTDYQSTGAYLTTAALSEDSSKYAGTNGSVLTTAGTDLALTLNTSGATIAYPKWLTTAQPMGAYLTTAALSGDTTKYAGVGETTATQAGTALGLTANTDGVNIAYPAWLTTAQPVGAYLTTAALSGDTTKYAGVGETTATVAGTTLGLTVNTDGVNIAYPNWLTTAALSGDTSNYAGTSTGMTGGSVTLNTSGIAISLPAYLTTAAATNITSARAGTNTSVQTTAGTDISIALNTSGLTVAYPAYITTYVNDLTSARAGTNTSVATTAGTDLTLGVNTSGVTIGYPKWITTYVNDLTSARAGTNTSVVTTAGTDLSFAVNTSGATIAYPAWITRGLAVSNSQTLFSTGTVAFSEGGGAITIASSAGGQSLMFSVPQTSSIVGTNGITVSITGSTISISAGNYLTTAAQSSQTLQFSLSGNIATTNSSQISNGAYVLAGGNNVTLQQSNNTISISAGVNFAGLGETTATQAGTAMGLTVDTAGVNIAYPAWLTTAALSADSSKYAGTSTGMTGGSVTLNTSGIAISLPAYLTTAAQSSAMQSYWNNIPFVQGTSSFSLQSNSLNVQPFMLPYAISMSYIRVPVSFANLTSTTVALTAGSSSFFYYQSINAVLYSQGAGASSRSLQQFASSYAGITEAFLFSASNAGTNESIAYRITYPLEGNNTDNAASTMLTTAGGASIFLHTTGVMSNFSGIHHLDIPFATSLSAGNYWIAFNRSTSSTTSGGGIAITGNVNRAHTFIAVSQINSNFVPLGYVSAGGATASTQPNWQIGLGSHSVSAQGATTGSLALSSISSVANFPIIPMQFIRQA